MGAAALPLAIAAAAVSTLGNIQQQRYQAAVARNNARIAEQNANAASTQAQLEQIRSDRETAAMLGQQEVAQAASGYDILGRSALGARRTAQRVGRDEASDIIGQGSARSRNFLQDASQFRGDAKNANRQAMFSAVSGALKIGSMATPSGGSSAENGSLLGSVKRAGARWRGEF